jgi:hypothetical protein
MRESQPLKRASAAKKEINRVQRKLSDPKKRKKLLPGEIEHVEDMVVILALAGYSRTQTGQIVGVSRGQVREILERPHVTEKLILLRKKLPDAALELLKGYMIEAITTIAQVMRSSEDDKFVLQAAAEILDRAGLPKASRQERHTVNEDKTTFSDDGLLEKLRTASPQVQEEAAQMIEGLENLLTAAAEENSNDEVGDGSA